MSPDREAVWRDGKDIKAMLWAVVPNTADWVNPNEATVAELPDGRVVRNARSESKAQRRLVTVSVDGATKWTRPAVADALPVPICFGSLVARPGPRPLLVFANPDNLERAAGKATPGQGRDRKNLSLHASADGGAGEGARAGAERVFGLGGGGGGGAMVFYERAAAGGTTSYGRLTLARVPPAWLRAE